MEESYKKKMEALGYDHFVCEIFGDWENVKDEILLPDRKSGSGNGTVHVILGAADSFLRNENGTLFGNPASPFINGILVLISGLFLIPGAVYGRTVGVYTKEKGVCDAMGKAMGSMGSFLALAFVSSQFINYFNYTKLGTIVALNGANF